MTDGRSKPVKPEHEIPVTPIRPPEESPPPKAQPRNVPTGPLPERRPAWVSASQRPDDFGSNTTPVAAPAASSKWASSLRKSYERFLKIRGNPREIALGFALGIFIGMTPFMGLHTAIAIFVAALVKWNKFAAAIAVWITNPVTAPVIYSVTYLVGARIVDPDQAFVMPNRFDLETLISLVKMGPDFLWILLIGGIVAGLPLAVAAYFLAFGAIVEYRKTIRLKIVKSTQTLKSKLHPPHRSRRKSRKGKKKKRKR